MRPNDVCNGGIDGKLPSQQCSLQVYRATLKPDLGGGDVAIKVLRPGVLEQVALDLYIIRHLAGVLGKNSNTDWLGVIDNWAVRFFHEMDYMREADTADIFRGHMAPLSGILVRSWAPLV